MMKCPITSRSGKICLFVSVLTLAAFSCQASGQQAPSSQAADALFAESKWEPAARAYADITAKEPANGAAWQHLGECDIQLQRFDDAIHAFQHAVDLKYRPLMSRVDIARAYVAKADTRRALDVLKEVSATGQAPRLRAYVARASEFQKLRDNAEYQEFLKSTLPCQTAEFRQFDFWLGDWDVHNPAGQKVGDNLVTREQDGCLLVEHWKSARGVESGTSFNYYDIRDMKFHQIYFDNSGNAGAYPPMAGGLVDNRKVMISDEKVSPSSAGPGTCFRRARCGRWRNSLTTSRRPGASSGVPRTSTKRSRPANKKRRQANLLTALCKHERYIFFGFGGVAGSAGLLASCLPGRSAGFMLTSPFATSSYSGFGIP